MCEVVIRNMDQVNDIIIYGRSIPKNLKDAVMRELIDLFSITVTQKGVVIHALPVRISPVLIVKITDKLPYTFMMIPLIISFDRGCEYC